MKEIPFVKSLVNEVLNSLNPKFNFKNILSLHGDYMLVDGEKFLLNKRIHIFALGKAASFQLEAVKELLVGYDVGHLVSYTKTGHTVENSEFYELEGTHPVVSELNIKNTEIFIDKLSAIEKGETLIFLLSGGGSSLLEKPVDSLSFEELQKKHEELLNSGENINSMNKARKALSLVKNGGLLNFIKTKDIIQFVTCDIPNEKIEDISSGPLLSEKKIGNNPKTFILNSGTQLLNELCGENSARVLGKIYDCPVDDVIKDLLKSLPQKNKFHFSGGEGTVRVQNSFGKGGRNTHFTLAFANELYKNPNNRDVKVMSIGTDGGDGPTDAAGAYIDFEHFRKLDPTVYLEEFNSYNYFKEVGTLIKTGPTQTNVMDLRCIWRE